MPRGYAGLPKDRPWTYDDYLVLSWMVDEKATVKQVAQDLHRTDDTIRERVAIIPWDRIRQARADYQLWCKGIKGALA